MFIVVTLQRYRHWQKPARPAVIEPAGMDHDDGLFRSLLNSAEAETRSDLQRKQF